MSLTYTGSFGVLDVCVLRALDGHAPFVCFVGMQPLPTGCAHAIYALDAQRALRALDERALSALDVDAHAHHVRLMCAHHMRFTCMCTLRALDVHTPCAIPAHTRT